MTAPPPPPSADPAPAKASPRMVDAWPGPTPPRVLVVDDRAEGRLLLAVRLGHEGCQVLQAEGGQQALALAAQAAPDLVLLDVLMPGMDGFETCRRLRAMPAMQAVPIVMVTSLEATDDCVRGLEAGADDFIIKPFNPAELRARVRSLLRTKALHDAGQRQQAALAEWSATLERRVADGARQLERLSRLKRFFSPRLAQRLTSERGDAALDHHRAEITVLFGDLRGFSAYAERHPPEQVMSLLAEFHQAMGRLIFDAEGTLERFTGDGMMVFFNDPDPQPDHSPRALQLACELQRAAAPLVARWHSEGGPGGLAIGLARGPAAIGAVGFEGRIDYAAIGAATNLAARLCAQAPAGDIWACPAVHAHTRDRVAQQALPAMALRGFAQPVRPWRVLLGP